MKALVGAFNQEKALVGAFSVIVQPVVEPMEYYTALAGGGLGGVPGLGAGLAARHAALLPREVAIPLPRAPLLLQPPLPLLRGQSNQQTFAEIAKCKCTQNGHLKSVNMTQYQDNIKIYKLVKAIFLPVLCLAMALWSNMEDTQSQYLYKKDDYFGSFLRNNREKVDFQLRI